MRKIHIIMYSLGVITSCIRMNGVQIFTPKNTYEIRETCNEVVETPQIPKKAYEITEIDRELLIKLVYLEGRGESYEGKKAIASIVFNRLDSNYWGDTIQDVIFAKNQFSPSNKIKNLKIHNDDIWEECTKAVDDVIYNGSILPSYILYFRANYYFSWATPYTSIGNHYFSYLDKDYRKFLTKSNPI